MEISKFRVWMRSRPAMCREFYDGYVLVAAKNPDAAIEQAKDRAARTHGHRDWVVERVDILRDQQRDLPP